MIEVIKTTLTEKGPEYKEIRVVGQCKALSNKVNKSDVVDIRDTIENHNCQGYFLAVSSYVTSQLSSHLDKMRAEERYWIDWWGRDEIEERLSRNEDILAKYSSIVKPIPVEK